MDVVKKFFFVLRKCLSSFFKCEVFKKVCNKSSFFMFDDESVSECGSVDVMCVFIDSLR